MKKLITLFIFVLFALSAVPVLGAEVKGEEMVVTTERWAGSEPVPPLPGATKDEVKAIVSGVSKEVNNLKESLSGKQGLITTMKIEVSSLAESTSKLAKATKEIATVTGQNVEAIKKNTIALQQTQVDVGNRFVAVSQQIKNNAWLIGCFTVACFLIVFLYCVHSRKRTRNEVGNLENSIILVEDKINTIRRVIKPDSRTIKFCAGGVEYEYDVPVDERGMFISIAALKVNAGDEPKTPAETARRKFKYENDVKKSNRTAMNEYAKPDCDPIQKDLINFLMDEEKTLRKTKA